MQTGSTSREVVVDLTTYRQTKQQSNERVPMPPNMDAEQTITEIAKYVLLIAQAIRRPRY